jgi:hypothetical protein
MGTPSHPWGGPSLPNRPRCPPICPMELRGWKARPNGEKCVRGCEDQLQHLIGHDPPQQAGLKVRTARSILAGMAKKLEPPKPMTWTIFKIAAKAVRLGTVEAPDEAAAIEKGAAAFKVPAPVASASAD